MRTKLSLLLFALLGILGCTGHKIGAPGSVESSLVALSLSPPALIEMVDGAEIQKIPLDLPCPPQALFPSPVGRFLVIEIMCAYGPVSLLLDTESGKISRLFAATTQDSHFLAWAADGKTIYLRVDSLANPRLIAVDRTTLYSETLPLPEFVYHLDASPTNGQILYALSIGIGYGSELWQAHEKGQNATLLYADPHNILAYARWSPDGRQIAFMKIPDTSVPFPLGELWVMQADGSGARRLSAADAGHGYAISWSPDGKRLAFVARLNPQDPQVEQVAEALQSTIAIVDVESGRLHLLRQDPVGRAETPSWSADGRLIAFPLVVDGRMSIQIAEWATGFVTPILTESACCPAWKRK